MPFLVTGTASMRAAFCGQRIKAAEASRLEEWKEVSQVGLPKT